MADDNEAEEAQEEEEYNPLDDPEYLTKEYFGEEDGGEGEPRTQADIGEEHGVTASTVSHYMKKHGIKTRANVVSDERLEDEEWLRAHYLGEDDADEGGEGEEMTMQEIADEIGCSDGTVMRRLHEFDIPVRRSSVGESAEDEEEDEAEDEEDGEE